MTRGQTKTIVRVNLADAGITFYSEDDLNDSIQDAYDDVAVLTQCILKTVNLNFTAYLSYYDFAGSFSISDYLGTTAIFNFGSNLWLRDDLSLRDLDGLRKDWELWVGQPQFWVSSDPKNIVIAPKVTVTTTGSSTGAFDGGSFNNLAFYTTNANPTSGFKLYYWAQAPTLTADSDSFLIATDAQYLIELYTTGDMLEQAQEFGKAAEWFQKYYPAIAEYAERVKRNNKTDLLMRV